MKRLLILCGGQSPEHVISIRSCKNVLAAVDRTKFSVTLIGITQDGIWKLMDESEIGNEITTQGRLVAIRPGEKDCFWSHEESLGIFDAVFPILHGPNGEDGTIQGMLRLLRLPFVGPDVLGSSVSMDKDVSKRLLRDAGLNVADWTLIRNDDSIPTYKELSEGLGGTLFVKPANMGSSVGVHQVTCESEWEKAIEDAFLYDRKVLVEEFIKGRELECAILGNENPKASGIGEIRSGEFYTYDEKYSNDSVAEVIIPAEVDMKSVTELRKAAIQAYKALDCEGLSRVDMFLTDAGKIYVNEINTIPGFTSISMYPKLWKEEGISYSELITDLVDLAIKRSSR